MKIRAIEVEHEGKVPHPIGVFGDPEQQVEVGRLLEAGPKASRALGQRAPDQGEPAQVHLPEEELGRPVGLEVRRAPFPTPIDGVLVAVEDVERWV